MINSWICSAQVGLILAAFIGILLSWTDATKCLKDQDLPEYPVNVYYCDDASKPTCCQKDSEFTCCEEEADKNMKEQLQLWGSIIGVGILIAMFWICYRKDTYICEGDTMSKRFKNFCASCRGKKPEEEDDKKVLPSYPEEEDMREHRQIDRRDTALTSRDIDAEMCRPSTSTADLRGRGYNQDDYNPGPPPGGYSYDSDSGRGSTTSSPHVSPVPLHVRSDLNEPTNAHSYELRSMAKHQHGDNNDDNDDDQEDVTPKKSKKGKKKHSKSRHSKHRDADVAL